MEINLLNQKKIKISGYGKNQFLISGKKYKNPILILGIDTKFGKDFYLKRNSKIELMSTSAACRTLNILFSEGRNIGALLFPIN